MRPGEKYNMLTAIARAENRGDRVIWEFRCDCGNNTFMQACRVVNGTSKSCGCQSAKNAGIKNTKHGKTKHPLYKVWSGIKQRCSQTSGKNFSVYGAKGISICEEWKDFDAFYSDMIFGYEKGLLIDRIDGSKGYCKANCRWVDAAVSGQNTSQVKLTVELARKIRLENATAKQLSRKYKVGVSTINDLRQWLTWKNA